MKMGTAHQGCRYWGYQPAWAGWDGFHANTTLDEKKAARERLKADNATIKAAGFKPTRYGLRAKIAAIGEATRIEKATGVEMAVFNHDYL